MPVSRPVPDPVAAAKWFLGHGFTVFPVWYPKTSMVCSCPEGARCAQPGKHPAVRDGFHAATADPAMVETALKNPGTRNYGLVVPVDVIAVDVDGPDGLRRWEELQKTFGPLPVTLTTETKHGRHYFFTVPGGHPSGKMFDYVVRDHDSGYVIGPGSKHASGFIYDTLRDAHGQPYPIAPLPEGWLTGWMTDRGARKGISGPSVSPRGLIEVQSASEGYALPDDVAEGARYEAVVSYTAHLHNTGISPEEQWALVRDVLGPRLHPAKAESVLYSDFERATKGMAERLGPPIRPAAAPIVIVSTPAAGLIVPSEVYEAAQPTAVERLSPISAVGYVSLIYAPPKTGKSTFLSQLQRCLRHGGLFLGFDVPVRPTLLVTEESGFAVVRKTKGIIGLDVLDAAAGSEGEVDYAKLLGMIDAWAAEQGPGSAVFIDTLAYWAELKDENDASEMNRVIKAAKTVTVSRQIAMHLVHHSRKGSGSYGEGIRGSSATAGAADTLVEMRHVKVGSTDRVLDLVGRVDDGEVIDLSYDPLTREYVRAIGSGYTEVDEMLGGIPEEGAGPGLTVEDLDRLWRGRDVRGRIKRLMGDGRLVRARPVRTAGTGSPPYRYWSVPGVALLLTPADAEVLPAGDARPVGVRMAELLKLGLGEEEVPEGAD